MPQAGSYFHQHRLQCLSLTRQPSTIVVSPRIAVTLRLLPTSNSWITYQYVTNSTIPTNLLKYVVPINLLDRLAEPLLLFPEKEANVELETGKAAISVIQFRNFPSSGI